ncbi:hypothetical protein D3C75_863280 [compost metagenome]
MAVEGVGDAARGLNADHKHRFRLRQLSADLGKGITAGQLVNMLDSLQLQR